jgi:hypothetical protein
LRGSCEGVESITELPIFTRGKATLYQLMSNMLIQGGKYLWFFHSMIALPKSLACSVNLMGKIKVHLLI